MFLIYSLLFTLGVMVSAPYYLWRLRARAAKRAGWRERFGFLPSEFQQSEGPDGAGAIWIHAVSVGETLALAGLIGELQSQFPERKIFLSHVTPEGRLAGEKRLPHVSGRFYLPLDWTGSLRRALKRIRPALLLIVETELWPNLVRNACEFGARVVLVNARLSARSFRGYRFARPFMRRVLAHVHWIGAQSRGDAERFVELGAPAERVTVAGNLKFDAQSPRSSELAARLSKFLDGVERGPVVVAASTMAREEPLVLRAWDEIRRHYPWALLILAPRHPARFEEVARLLNEQGRTFLRRSSLATGDPAWRDALEALSLEVLLLDTIGELAGVLELADAVFIGGSLVPTGGHNLLEAAYWGKPILFGPHMENFRDVSELFLRAGAAIQVRNPDELARETTRLLGDREKQRRLGEAAKKVLVQEMGATRRVLEHLRPWLEVRTPVHATIPEGERP